MMNASICIMYNKHNTTRKILCTVFTHSLVFVSVTDRVSAANEEIEKILLNFKQEKKIFTKKMRKPAKRIKQREGRVGADFVLQRQAHELLFCCTLPAISPFS